MTTATVLVLLVAAISVDHSLSVLPGFKIRLTKKGLDYANKVAQTSLADELKSLKIPDQRGHDGHIDWSLTGIQNRGSTVPTSNMAFTPAQNGLTWTMSNLGIDLHSDWRVKYKKGWFHVSTSGSVDLNIKRVSLQVTIRLAQSGGRPSVSMAKCVASIGDVDVHFHGGTAFILNMFKGVIGRKIRDLMQGKICQVVQKVINVNANKKLSQIKVNVEIDHRFLLNYSLVAAPTIHATDLETQHKGEVFWKGDTKEAPFSPKPIPALADESRMMYLWITDYMANSFTYTAQLHKFLQYNVTKNDFPADHKDFLNTTCKKICIGKFIPQIGKKYPNSMVEARVMSLQAPNFTITPKGMAVTMDVKTGLYAHTPDKKVPYLATLKIALSMSVKGSVVKEHVTGQITSHSVKVSVVKSAVGKINPAVLNIVMKGALDFAVIPELNAIMKKGLELPVTGSVSFQNTQITLLNGSAFIATDLKYQKSSELTVISERLL